MSAISMKWLLLVSCMATVVVSAPTSSEESFTNRRDAQSSSETETQVPTKLIPPSQSRETSTTESPERKIRAAQEQKPEQQPIPDKATTETPEFVKSTEVKREAQSQTEPSPAGVSTTKLPERKVRAAQEGKTDQPTTTKTTTENSEDLKPKEIKRDAQFSSKSEEDKTSTYPTQTEKIGTTTSPERKARAAQQGSTDQSTTSTEIPESKKPEVKREVQSSSESEEVKATSSTEPGAVSTTKLPERKVRAAQEGKPVQSVPNTGTSEVQKPEEVKNQAEEKATTEVDLTPLIFESNDP